MLERLFEAVLLPCEVLVVVDDAADTTRPVVQRLAEREPRLHCLINDYGKGPANAIRYGIDHATTPVAVVTMADGCDDVRQIDDLVRLVERGVAVAAASRYMAGGQQVGGPLLKGMMSASAGRSLRMLARVGTRDATNSFKAYSTDVRPGGRHRQQGRVRDRHRADRQGQAAPAADCRDPHDLAGPARRPVQLPGRGLAPQVPAVVPVRVRPRGSSLDELKNLTGSADRQKETR